MNKEVSKKIFNSLGVNTPVSVNLDQIKKKKTNFPLIIKPVSGGSSNGLVKVNNANDIEIRKKENKFLSSGIGRYKDSKIVFKLGDRVPMETDLIAAIGAINNPIVFSFNNTPNRIGIKYLSVFFSLG